MSEQLKPCPFCGGPHEKRDDGHVGCASRRCHFAFVSLRPKVWNTRPVEDALRAERDAAVRERDGADEELAASREEAQRLREQRVAAEHKLDNLKALFMEYGTHKNHCATEQSGSHAKTPCDCGFRTWAKACEDGNEETLA